MEKTPATILSFGAGQDSTALLYKYVYSPEFRNEYAPGKFMVVCSDTGDEHPATYHHIEEVKVFCKKHDIEFHHLTADRGYHKGDWKSLRGFYNAKKAVGSKAFPKTCTDRLKLTPIYNFIEDWLTLEYDVKTGRKKGFYEYAEKYGKLRVIIGIAAGEEKRVGGVDTVLWRERNVEKVYPLVSLNMDRKACQDYIMEAGHKVPPPSNCVLCPFVSEQELVWLYRNQPHDYHDWVRIEQNKFDNNRHLPADRNLGVWGKAGKSLVHILEGALEKFGHWTLDELNLYKMSHGHCVMSKY